MSPKAKAENAKRFAGPLRRRVASGPSMVTLPAVQAALGRIRDQIYLSPCARSETLSRLTGTSAFLKLENLQMTGAYKERGALNRLLTLTPAERAPA